MFVQVMCMADVCEMGLCEVYESVTYINTAHAFLWVGVMGSLGVISMLTHLLQLFRKNNTH